MPLVAMAKTSLLAPPSIWMLLNRLFCPPIELETTRGSVPIRSVKLRPCSGSEVMVADLTVVTGPPRLRSPSTSRCATTAISSTKSLGTSMRFAVSRWPRLSWMSSWMAGL